MRQALHLFYGAGDLHFVTSSCYRRQSLLGSEVRRDLFLRTLEWARRRYLLVILAYVVMPEHIHLLLSEPRRATLSTVIQALKLGSCGAYTALPRFPGLARAARPGALRSFISVEKARFW
jgi:REP element-mobilizing transposase RayT